MTATQTLSTRKLLNIARKEGTHGPSFVEAVRALELGGAFMGVSSCENLAWEHVRSDKEELAR